MMDYVTIYARARARTCLDFLYRNYISLLDNWITRLNTKKDWLNHAGLR